MDKDQLKAKRLELDLTQQRLADLLEVKLNTVSRWERGTLPISRTVELALKAIETELSKSKKT